MEFSPDFVRELDCVENSFLQILLSEFSLVRSGSGFELNVAFDGSTPAIWNRHAKRHVRERIPRFAKKALAYQKDLDARLLHGDSSPLRFSDPEFPFRYVSGGVLPVLWMNGEEYFCLFYRDIEPIGWNIANGGSDSRAECAYPAAVIEREFREELIALNVPAERSKDGYRYVFNWDSGSESENVEHAMARRLWMATFPGRDVEKFRQLRLPVRWIQGPDTVSVRMSNGAAVVTPGCFLNINAADHGIEVDKIAHVHLGEGQDDLVLLDGEIMDQKVLGRPVGLFRVDKTLAALGKGSSRFIPDLFFHEGIRLDSRRFDPLIRGKFTASLAGLRTAQEIKRFTGCSLPYDLCPVTRSILTRYAALRREERAQPAPAPPSPPAASGFDTFISCGRGDEDLAQQVYEHVTRRGRKAFFYRTHPTTDYLKAIAEALDSASCLILVATHADRVRRRFPEEECRAFLNAFLTERKREAKLIPFIPGVNPHHLDILVANRNAIETLDLAAAFNKLDCLLDD